MHCYGFLGVIEHVYGVYLNIYWINYIFMMIKKVKKEDKAKKKKLKEGIRENKLIIDFGMIFEVSVH